MDSNLQQYKDYSDIRGIFWTGGVKRQWGGRKRRYSVLSVAISSEPLQIRPKLLYVYIQPLTGFPVTQNR